MAINLTPKQELRSIQLVRLAGYGLLLFALFDFVHLLVPLRLMNTAWEFQTLGNFVERVPLLLLGVVLTFFSERTTPEPLEALFLRTVTTLCLGLGILFLALVPLGIVNTTRLIASLPAQFNPQTDPQLTRLRELKIRIKEADTPAEIRRLLTGLTIRGKSPDLSDPLKARQSVMDDLPEAEQSAVSQLETQRADQRLIFYRNSVKWNLGALVASLLFFRIWRLTHSAWRKWPGSVALVRLAGYALVLFAGLDFIHLLIPLRLANPGWQFQLAGAFVERLPIPLLGLALLFYGERSERSVAESLLLKGASCLTLTLAVACLFVIPLAALNTHRLDGAIAWQIQTQADEQLARLQNFKGRLTEASAPGEIERLFSAQATQTGTPDLSDPDKLKQKTLENLAETERNLLSRAETARSEQRLALYKNSVKWNVTALLAAVLFLRIWQITRWVWHDRIVA